MKCKFRAIFLICVVVSTVASLRFKAQSSNQKRFRMFTTRKQLGEYLDNDSSFRCTGGRDPASMDYAEYLTAFRQGPCSPVIVIAGITATKLRVQIDCEKLKAERPEIFASCGWTTCTGSVFSTLRTIPKSEYTFWLPDATSPFNILNKNLITKDCFGNLYGMPWDEASGRISPKSVPGIQIVPLGLTEETRKTSKCGFDAISDMYDPSYFIVVPRQLKMFTILREELENKGYIVGLTAHALPYDWRKTSENNEVGSKLEQIAEEIVTLVGKKPSIIAHSYGNINFLKTVANLTSERKSKLINRYFALAPPFLGSPSLYFSMVASDPDPNAMIDFKKSKITAQIPGNYDLLPRTTWNLFRESSWLRSIQNRAALESRQQLPHSLSKDEDIVAQLFPAPDEVCFNPSLSSRSQDCLTGLTDFDNFGKINGDDVTASNLTDILDRYSYLANAKKSFEYEMGQAKYDQLQNPGVPTTIVYTNNEKTTFKLYYDSDPKLKTSGDSGQAAKASREEFNLGDGSVLSTSCLAPGIKWADEFKRDKPNTFPVTFAEICSRKYQRDSVQIGGVDPADNNYHGIRCDCESSPESCGHSPLVTDSGVVEYLVKSLEDGQKASHNNQISSRVIQMIVKSCAFLNN